MSSKTENLATPLSLELAMTYAQARQHVTRCFRADPNAPVFLLGPPGVGKTALIGDVGKALDGQIVPVYLNATEPAELKGLPKTVEDPHGDWTTIYARNAEFPSPKDEGLWIFFLDDVNVVPQSLQTIAFQMAQQRRITKSYEFPKDNRVALAGNRLKDRSAVHLLPMPLIGRMSVIEVMPDAQGWVRFARDKGLHPAVISYVAANPERIIYFTKEDAENNRPFPSPRSYENVAHHLSTYTAEEVLSVSHCDEERELLVKSLASFVGRETASHKFEGGSLYDHVLGWASQGATDRGSLQRKVEGLFSSRPPTFTRQIALAIAALATVDVNKAAIFLLKLSQEPALLGAALRACPDAAAAINGDAKLKTILAGVTKMTRKTPSPDKAPPLNAAVA